MPVAALEDVLEGAGDVACGAAAVVELRLIGAPADQEVLDCPRLGVAGGDVKRGLALEGRPRGEVAAARDEGLDRGGVAQVRREMLLKSFLFARAGGGPAGGGGCENLKRVSHYSAYAICPAGTRLMVDGEKLPGEVVGHVGARGGVRF